VTRDPDFKRRAGLSATAGLSCSIVIIALFSSCLTDEEEDEEDDVDDEFSKSRLDLDVALRAVLSYSRAPQRCNRQNIHLTQTTTISLHESHYSQIPDTLQIQIRALILFIQTLALYKSFTYLLTYFISVFIFISCAAVNTKK